MRMNLACRLLSFTLLIASTPSHADSRAMAELVRLIDHQKFTCTQIDPRSRYAQRDAAYVRTMEFYFATESRVVVSTFDGRIGSSFAIELAAGDLELYYAEGSARIVDHNPQGPAVIKLSYRDDARAGAEDNSNFVEVVDDGHNGSYYKYRCEKMTLLQR